MTWMDIGIGLCGCGTERRLFQAEGEDVGKCSACTIGKTRKEASVELVQAQACRTSYDYFRERRQRLAMSGKCIDCERMRPMTGVMRCRKCHTKMLDHNRHAKGAA